MASNLTIAITAETADLQAKLAVAQANFRSLSSELKTAAQGFIGLDDAARGAALPALDAAAAAAAKARAELAALHEMLEAAADKIAQADATANLAPGVGHALADLARAYSLAMPVCRIARQSPAHRRSQGAELGELLAQLAVAEIVAITALSRARSSFLFRALREIDEAQTNRLAVEG